MKKKMLDALSFIWLAFLIFAILPIVFHSNITVLILIFIIYPILSFFISFMMTYQKGLNYIFLILFLLVINLSMYSYYSYELYMFMILYSLICILGFFVGEYVRKRKENK